VSAQKRLLSPEYFIGFQGGATASSVLWSPKVPGAESITSSALLSGTGGLVFRYSGHRCCGVQVELNYARRGWQEKEDATATSAERHYTRILDYIELPVLTHIYFGKHHVRGFVNLGPQIGYCVHESQSGTMQTTEVHQYAPLDNPFAWGVAGGLGIIGMTDRAGCFQLEARFTYGLGALFSSSTTSHFQQSNMMTLSVNLAYFIPLRRKQNPQLSTALNHQP